MNPLVLSPAQQEAIADALSIAVVLSRGIPDLHPNAQAGRDIFKKALANAARETTSMDVAPMLEAA